VNRLRVPGGSWRVVVLVVLIGLALGVLTVLGQGVLPDNWNRIANSGAVWVAVAFAVGAFMASDRTAALAGAATLVGAVIGYYVTVPWLVEGAASSSRSVAIWGVTALVGGPVFGLAGRWWRTGTEGRRAIAIGLLGGAFAGEGAYTMIHIASPTGSQEAVAWAMLAMGVAIPLLLGRSLRGRTLGLVLMVSVGCLVFAAYSLIDLVFRSG
jgi:Family of unknown function (DUF6518)